MEQNSPNIPIDELPDSLLIHILSFLTVKEAAITCVLSKRWQFLWYDVSSLQLWESENENEDPHKTHRFVALEKTRRYVAWVNRFLAVRPTYTVDKFSLRMQYHQSYDSKIDNWIGYALRNRVKTLILLIHSRYIKESYTLPEAIYSCKSLQHLLVQGGHIVMGSFGKINWGCLTELYLENVELDQELVDDILTGTGCSVLGRFELKRCFGYSRLEAESPRLDTLVVEDSDDGPLPLHISAPYLRFLDISFYPDGRLVKLGDIGCLHKARINFISSGFNPDEVIMSYTKVLLQYIRHVEELQLKRKFFEVISMLAVTGWQLPQSTRCCLEVSSSVAYKYNVSGIMALLDSSPNLETLVLEGFSTDGNYTFPNSAANGDLYFNLSCLKSIYFRNFTDSNGEPMLTLVRILLKRTPVLENIVIVVDGVESSDDFIKIYQELLFFPRIIAVSCERYQYQRRSRYKATISFR